MIERWLEKSSFIIHIYVKLDAKISKARNNVNTNSN